MELQTKVAYLQQKKNVFSFKGVTKYKNKYYIHKTDKNTFTVDLVSFMCFYFIYQRFKLLTYDVFKVQEDSSFILWIHKI
jgi:hypothetical protein